MARIKGETREAAARWARHRSNEGVLLGKSWRILPRQRRDACGVARTRFRFVSCPDCCSHKVLARALELAHSNYFS